MSTSTNNVLFSGYIATVQTVAELRAKPVSGLNFGASIIVNGNQYAGDLDGGVFAYYPDDETADDGLTVIAPIGGAGRWKITAGKGLKGDAGTAGNVAATLADLKAAATANDTMIYDGAPFKWTTANPPYTADDTNIVKANSTALSVGAWVRQKLSSIQTDDGTSAQAAISARKANTPLTGYSDPILGCGVIRKDTADTDWYYLDDAGHTPGNLSGAITVNGSGDVVLPYGYTVNKVGQLTVTPDETFAGLGLIAGASVGNSTSTLSLYMPMHIAANLGSTSTGTAGIATGTYFTGDVTAVKTGADVVITHPTVGSASSAPVISNMTTTADGVGYDVRITGYTATTVSLATFVPFTFTVHYDGSNWVIDTPMAVAPTVTSFTGNALTIAYNQTLPVSMLHAEVSAFDDATVAVCRALSVATTQISLVFRNGSNATLGTPTTGMRATVRLPLMVKAATPIGRATIIRPNTKLNGSKVFSGSGNFWINSMHKAT